MVADTLADTGDHPRLEVPATMGKRLTTPLVWCRVDTVETMDAVETKGGKPVEYLSVTEAAREIDCCRATVWRAIRKGELPAVRTTRRGPWRIRRDDLDKLKPLPPQASRNRPPPPNSTAETSAPGEELRATDELIRVVAVEEQRRDSSDPSYLLPELEPSPEAKMFIQACREIRQVRIQVKGPDSVRPIPGDLAETFDKHARTKWPQVTDWKETINDFREYWCTPDMQKKPRTFDYWRRFRNWCSKEVTGHGNRRPSGRLDPSGRQQRYLDEFETDGCYDSARGKISLDEKEKWE